MTAPSPQPQHQPPPSAAVELARRTLLAPGGEVHAAEVMRTLREAARQGDGEAAKQLATFNASGAWTPRAWFEAVDWLRIAAEAGSASAQGQLQLLSPEGATWGERAAGVDLNAWLTPPDRTPVLETPRVRLSRGFASTAVCDWLRGLAAGRLQRARMVEGYEAEPKYTNARTNSDFMFTIFDADCVLAMVRERISLLLRLPTIQMEPPQVFHYAPGQELRPHVDYLQRGDRAAGYQGDRIATFLLYLNDDFEGGETWFVRPDLKVKGRTGDALYFANVTPDGAPDPQSLHAGLPPTQGEKWLLSQWVHDRPFAG